MRYADEIVWYFAKHGQQQGPVELEALKAQLQNGALSPGDLVWREGMPEWTPAREVPELLQRPESGVEQGAAGGAGGAPAPSAPTIVAPPPSSGLAIASLVCGISGLLLCYVWVLGALPAVICGHMSLKRIRESPVPVTGRGMALAGLITGYLGLVFQVLAIVGFVFLLLQMNEAQP